MNKIIIEISREFFEKYRSYKIDLVMEECKINMEYELFRHTLEMGGIKYNDITQGLNKCDTITITSEGKIHTRNQEKETAEYLARIQNLIR